MDQTCGLRHPKAVNSGLSWAAAELVRGGGLTLELPGPGGAAREKWGLEGDTGSQGTRCRTQVPPEGGWALLRGPQTTVRPRPVGPLRKAH